MSTLTLSDLRRFVKATGRLPGDSLLVLSVPADYPPKPFVNDSFNTRRLLATVLQVDGGQHGCEAVAVIEGRYDADPKTTPVGRSIGGLATQEAKA